MQPKTISIGTNWRSNDIMTPPEGSIRGMENDIPVGQTVGPKLIIL